MNKKEGSYKTISEVAEILGLKDIKKGTLSTHTIRFWEKEFDILKPKKIHGKFQNKSCVSWRILNQAVDIEDLIVEGEYKEIASEQ